MESTAHSELWRNHGRMHPVWRVLLFLFAVIVSLNVASAILFLISPLPKDEVGAAAMQDPRQSIFVVRSWLELIIIFGFAAYFIRRLDRQTTAVLGLESRPGWQREVLIGLALGCLMIAAIFVAFLALHLAVLTSAGGSAVMALLLSAASMLPLALSEEILFRGYVLRNLVQQYGARVGILITALLFSLGHMAGPSRSLIPLLSIAMAGLLLGYAYLKSGSLWLPFALHFAWNFTQGALLGMPVSGWGFPGVVLTLLRQPYWLSGGPIGPEGSILAPVALLIGLWFLHRHYRAGEA